MNTIPPIFRKRNSFPSLKKPVLSGDEVDGN
jgi:hypothetical protein